DEGPSSHKDWSRGTKVFNGGSIGLKGDIVVVEVVVKWNDGRDELARTVSFLRWNRALLHKEPAVAAKDVMEMEPDIENMTMEEYLDVPIQVSEVMGDVMQSFTSQAIHITPPDDACVVSATNHILDELLKEFGDELLDTTMVDGDADCNPIMDIEDLV
nr:phytochrome B [Tanacetum cinerariifolium]